jgi:hypothetical protein
VHEAGVQLDEAVEASVAVPAELLDDPGFVDFAVTGTPVRGEFRCSECGYGAVVQRVLPLCPMCGGTVWESRGPLEARRVD